MIVGVDPDPASKEKISTGRRDYWEALHPHSARRRLRELHDGRGRGPREGQLRENYTRLTKIKKKYDPANLFRVNQNIKPAT